MWTQTPGQSKPMWEAMKSPAQELGVLSRSCRNKKIQLVLQEKKILMFCSCLQKRQLRKCNSKINEWPYKSVLTSSTVNPLTYTLVAVWPCSIPLLLLSVMFLELTAHCNSQTQHKGLQQSLRPLSSIPWFLQSQLLSLLVIYDWRNTRLNFSNSAHPGIQHLS